MRRVWGIGVVLFFVLSLAGCNLFGEEEPEETPDELTIQLQAIYEKAVAAEVFSGTYEEWLESVRGPKGLPGEDGREVSLRVAEGHIQWQYVDEGDWTNLVELVSLVGPEGEAGRDGSEIVMQVSDTHIQWRHDGDDVWNDLVSLDLLIGPRGETGEDGQDGNEVIFRVYDDHIQWQYAGESEWNDLVELASLTGPKGDPGQDGIGIVSITLEEDGVLKVELTDGTVESFVVDMPAKGMSAYEIYRKHHPGYEEDEASWLEALIEGTLMYAPAELSPFTFAIEADGRIMITSYTGDEEMLVIPHWIAGYTVKGIADDAFRESADIEEVVITDGIEVIGERAFAGMADLRNIHIPASVTDIGANALKDTTELIIMTDHMAKPADWHPDWNPEDHDVGWFIVFDYHDEYFEVITTHFLTFASHGIDFDGEPFANMIKRHGETYYYDYGEEIVILTRDYPLFYKYEICPAGGCYTNKEVINHDQYSLYNDPRFEYARNLLYIANLEESWLERTVHGFRIKEDYLETAAPGISDGILLFAYEIIVHDDGFSIHVSMHAPPFEINQPGHVTQTFTQIGTTPAIPVDDYEPCDATVEELPPLGEFLETENVTLQIHTHHPETHPFREELHIIKLTESATERRLYFDGTQEGPPQWTYLLETEEPPLWYSSYFSGYDPATGSFEEFGWENPTEENTVLELYLAELEEIAISDYDASWFLEFEIGRHVLRDTHKEDMLFLLGEVPEIVDLEMFEIHENGEDITITFTIYDRMTEERVTKIYVLEELGSTRVSPLDPPE